MIVIYKYENIKNGMIYIGQTNNLKRRDKEHKNNYNNTYFDKVYHKHPEDFTLEVVCSVETKLTANSAEQWWIDYYDSLYPSGYNLTKGGSSVHGYKHTEESKRRMSENNAKYWTGKHLSKETKNKISKTKKGQKSGWTPEKSDSVKCVEIDIVFDCLKFAVEWLKQNGFPKASHSHISQCCDGKRKTAYKYHWERIAEVE